MGQSYSLHPAQQNEAGGENEVLILDLTIQEKLSVVSRRSSVVPFLSLQNVGKEEHP